ncbi:glycosyltransferase family 2 protein [Marinomonas sp. TW1]|uniref:glycosyltransferase family 2 protein n=1 Tax=Marinomonas sp. TW1 TaxID=1561203 RepID=UPI000A6A2FEF|nr:glycosyltransferase family 2 protein [Marinomonas sp. TW1]
MKSILNLEVTPKQVVLWLRKDLKNQIPRKLSELEGDNFEIHFSETTSSHRKFINSLVLYPEDVIVTCDDDSLYPDGWLVRLWQEHLEYPDQIIANRCNFISYDDKGIILPYKQWHKKVPPGTSHLAIMPAGYGGVLYPAHSLHSDVTNYDLFMKLAPKADDLWFKAMSFLKGTCSRRASHPSEKPMTLPFTQKFTLAKDNIKKDMNREQWNNIREYYQMKTPDYDTSE